MFSPVDHVYNESIVVRKASSYQIENRHYASAIFYMVFPLTSQFSGDKHMDNWHSHARYGIPDVPDKTGPRLNVP